MKTIALRFGEHFAPECGTIAAHQQIIDKLGYVWYGKMGSPVAAHIITELEGKKGLRILLINSGKPDRYWAYVSEITNETPVRNGIPEYYRDSAEKFKTWFKVTSFEKTQKDIMPKCFVISSGNVLSEVSKHSMNPYFVIDYKDSDL